MGNVLSVAAAVAVACGLLVAACSNASAGSPSSRGSTSGPCASADDCAPGYACGYEAVENTCSSSTGACIQLTSAPASPACGCNGLPVDYVAPGYVESPASSPEPCDAGASAEDSGAPTNTFATDGASDGSSADGATPNDAASAGDGDT
jgi:hypothetical protein